MKVILLSGYARVGKDTAAEVLVNRFDYQQLAFADKVKEVAEKLNPVVGNLGGSNIVPVTYNEAIKSHGEEEAKAKYPGLREQLVLIGGGLREVIDPDIWINAVAVEAIKSSKPGCVISDCRYLNEAAKYYGADEHILIWISRPGFGPANEEEEKTTSQLEELSDFQIENDKSIIEFQHHFQDMLEHQVL